MSRFGQCGGKLSTWVAVGAFVSLWGFEDSGGRGGCKFGQIGAKFGEDIVFVVFWRLCDFKQFWSTDWGVIEARRFRGQICRVCREV